MKSVAISVGGRRYTINCEEGQEERVLALAASLDEKFETHGPRYSQNLLFAALRMADEVFETAKASPGEDPQLAELRGQLADIGRERDRLEAALSSATDARGRAERDVRELKAKADQTASGASEQARKITELEARCATLEAELKKERQRSAAAVPSDSPSLPFGAPAQTDPALAPALERFAGLLETCADKLERRASTT